MVKHLWLFLEKSKMKKLYAIVPARAGSKRVKNKNIIKIKKLMLIDYTINYLLKINKVDKIIISTDIKKIINKYKKKKKILVIQRPKKISGDKSKSSDLVKHVLQVLKKKKLIHLNISFYLNPHHH